MLPESVEQLAEELYKLTCLLKEAVEEGDQHLKDQLFFQRSLALDKIETSLMTPSAAKWLSLTQDLEQELILAWKTGQTVMTQNLAEETFAQKKIKAYVRASV